MSEIIEQAKKNYQEENRRNKKIVGILKIVVYVVTALLFINMGSYFIINIIMEKSLLYYDHLSMPISLILFGIIAILLTAINPRMSKTSNVKGDKIELVIGVILTLGGIAYLIYELATM